MYTEYEIRAALIETLNTGLGVTKNSEYTVLASNAQVMTFGDKLVLVNKISTQRYGFQSRGYWCDQVYDPITKKWKAVKLKSAEQWIEEIVWQVSVIRKRMVEDDVGTKTAEDVAKSLVWWLNSDGGAHYMRNRDTLPFAPVFTKNTRSQVYEDDSDNHQVEEQFDFKMMVLQTADVDVKHIEGMEIQTHPI